ncbi:MAG TPA: hypothetical protein VFJ52_08965, partial [Terriglobia bacterium]|nr:hypothetical protein [Terriglobia bacterium]
MPRLFSQENESPAMRLVGLARLQVAALRLLGILTLVWMAVGSLRVVQYDFWWQLAEGDFLLRAGRLPDAPLASFAAPAAPFINEYPLYEALLALWHRLAGFGGLLAGFSALALAPFLLLLTYWWRSLTRAGSRVAFVGWLAIFCGWWCYYWRIQQRPELLGLFFVFAIGWWAARLSFGGSERRVGSRCASFECLAALLLFAAWANVHGSFWIGWGLLLLWCGQSIWERLEAKRPPEWLRFLGVPVAALLGMFAAPYGIDRVLLPFYQQADRAAVILSPEMR